MAYKKSHIFTIDVLMFDGHLDDSGRLSDPLVFFSWLVTQHRLVVHPILAFWNGKVKSLSQNWLDKRANIGQMRKGTGKPDFKSRFTVGAYMKVELITKYVYHIFSSLDLSHLFNHVGLVPLNPPSTHDIKDYQNEWDTTFAETQALISEMIWSLQNAFPNELSLTCNFKHANNQRIPVSKPSLSTQPHESMTSHLLLGLMLKAKVLRITLRARTLRGTSPHLVL